jgi:hypothetical protein
MSMMASFYCHGPLAFNMFKILAFVLLCFFPFSIVIVNKILNLRPFSIVVSLVVFFEHNYGVL